MASHPCARPSAVLLVVLVACLACVDSKRHPIFDQTKPMILWEGPMFNQSDAAVVADDLLSRLRKNSGLEVGAVATDENDGYRNISALPEAARAAFHTKLDAPDIVIRHEAFLRFDPPSSPTSRLVLYDTWEKGAITRDDVDRINAVVDEVWVPSNFVRDIHLAAGVSAYKVHVVSPGVDSLAFNPDVPSILGLTRRQFRFCYAGALDWITGIDVLLKVYSEEFSSADNVALLVRAEGVHANLGERKNRIGRDPVDVDAATPDFGWFVERQIERLDSMRDKLGGRPEVVVIGDELPRAHMPNFYASCDTVVAPFRTDGFARSVVEGMAAGRPPIVTDFGSASEYCTRDTAYHVDIGNWVETAVDSGLKGHFVEPDATSLAIAMRKAFEDGDERYAKGAAARAAILDLQDAAIGDSFGGKGRYRAPLNGSQESETSSSPKQSDARRLPLSWEHMYKTVLVRVATLMRKDVERIHARKVEDARKSARRGDLKVARRSLSGVLREAPYHVSANLELADVAEQLDLHAIAAHCHERLAHALKVDAGGLEPDSNATLYHSYHAGRLLYLDGNLEESQKWFEAALEIEPCHLDAMLTLGELLMETEEFMTLVELGERAFKCAPHDKRVIAMITKTAKVLEEIDPEAEQSISDSLTHL